MLPLLLLLLLPNGAAMVFVVWVCRHILVKKIETNIDHPRTHFMTQHTSTILCPTALLPAPQQCRFYGTQPVELQGLCGVTRAS